MRKILAVLLCLAASGGAVYAQSERPISQIQGEKGISPFEGKEVRTSGIVTARTRSGFFIQTPDDKTDKNPQTSEGIFVFTRDEPTVEATIGNLVSVVGTVEEFRPKQEPNSLPITEISLSKQSGSIAVTSKNNALPAPIVLSMADFAANDLGQLEKYEGMRVKAESLTVVSPTGGRIDDRTGQGVSNGVFYAVLFGIPRPFREKGVDIFDAVEDKLKEKSPKVPIFDRNPELIRIESGAQLGAQMLEVASGVQIRGVVGVLHYAYRSFSILPDTDAKLEPTKTIKPTKLPAPTARQFVVASTNLENFFDDEDDPAMKEDIVPTDVFQRRMNKISRAVREYMQTPDILGVIEVENLAVLKKLAAKINADATAEDKPNPQYEAFLIDGNDGRGIDSGFLVKTSRVKVLEVKQFGKDDKYKTPEGKEENLFDRPPLVVKAQIVDEKTNKPFEITVIVNHLKSFLGSNDPKDGGLRVRTKRKLEAEFMAKLVAERLKANPSERIALVGDFNAFQFNDGVVDVIGTISGKPAPKDEVLMASEDFLNPDLINLVNSITPEQRYSYVFDGSAQILDHFLINDNLFKHTVGFGYVRLNADFPETYRNDPNRVERFSDHDAAIAYFSLDPK